MKNKKKTVMVVLGGNSKREGNKHINWEGMC